jgi:hypothetical protein
VTHHKDAQVPCCPLVQHGKPLDQWPLKVVSSMVQNCITLSTNKRCYRSYMPLRSGIATYSVQISQFTLTTKHFGTSTCKKSCLSVKPDGWSTCHNTTVLSTTSMVTTIASQTCCCIYQTVSTDIPVLLQMYSKFDLTLFSFRILKTDIARTHGVKLWPQTLHGA